MPERWMRTVDGFAENGRRSYQVRELPMEEVCRGFGLGLCLLVTAHLVAEAGGRDSLADFRRRARGAGTPGGRRF